jgi:GlpG protein
VRRLFDTDDSENARRFSNYLNTQGIEAELREDGGECTLWIINEDQLNMAIREKAAFLADPFHSKYDVKAPKKKPEKEFPKKAGSARIVDVRSEVFSGAMTRMTVTYWTIGICVVLTMLVSSPQFRYLGNYLYFSNYMGREFPEILSGQVWRLITPVFLHGGLMHLGFNMLWMYQLGAQVENVESSIKLAVFIFVTALICNTSQYLISGPNFVGLSGVVYGMLGYIWAISRYAKRTNYFLSNGTMGFMVAWLVICLVGIIPNVANTQHVMGILIGLAWGRLQSLRT